MRIFSYMFLIIFSFWLVNCSAADGQKKHLIKIQKVANGITLGVLMTELNDRDKEKLQAEYGARVVDVVKDSPAEKAGLKAQDVIVALNDEKIESARELDTLVEAMEEGEDITLKILRDGREMTFDATLHEMEHSGYSYAFSDDEEGDNFTWHFSDGEEGDVNWFSDDINREIVVENIETGPVVAFNSESSKGGFLGIEGDNLSQQMLEYFEVEHGILVEKVLEDTPAEKAGLKAGDVITHIEGRKIEDYNDLLRTLKYYNPNEKVEIQYVRKGAEKSVDVTLAEKKNKFFFRNNGGTNVFKGHGLPRIWMGKGLKGIDDIDDNEVQRIFYII